MKYVKIIWVHNYESTPYLIYSEIDLDRYEIRKIDIYKDGTVGFAIDNIEYHGSGLSEKPFPSLQELNSKDEWDETIAEYIPKDEFERMWLDRVQPILSA